MVPQMRALAHPPSALLSLAQLVLHLLRLEPKPSTRGGLDPPHAAWGVLREQLLQPTFIDKLREWRPSAKALGNRRRRELVMRLR
jgi:hypothetical protein